MPKLVMLVLEIKFRSSCLWGKNLVDGAILPTLYVSSNAFSIKLGMCLKSTLLWEGYHADLNP